MEQLHPVIRGPRILLTLPPLSPLLLGMTQLIPSPSEYLTKSPNEWTERDLFEREVDWHCQHKSILRPRCREWVEFSERFVPFCEDWNGCWVAETAVFEWNLYLRLPEGEYKPLEYEKGYHFRMGYP